MSAQAKDILPRELLSPGAELTYFANDTELRPWIVRKLEVNQEHEGLSGCSHIEIEYEPDDVEESWECISGNVLLKHEGNSWKPTRPVVANQRLEIRDITGKITSLFETKDFSETEINGEKFNVLRTIVLNFNNDGSVKSRLIEEFSIGLGPLLRGNLKFLIRLGGESSINSSCNL